MSTIIRHAIAAVCVTLYAVEVAPADQARDRRAAGPAGTALVSGVVVSDEDPRQPIRGAIVSVVGDELPMGRTLISDANGRFEFTKLPAGSFTLKASKGGYLTTTLGSKRPEQRGTMLVVADGEQKTGVMLRLPRGGVITGTVTNARGEPMPGLQVSAVSVQSPESQPFSIVAPAIVTDDRGVYRIFGLTPGDYFVVASPPRTTSTPSGAAARSSAEIDAIFRFLRGLSVGETPRAMGRPASRPDLPPDKPPTYSYAPVFHPGSPLAAEATIVRLAFGEEREGVDIVMDLVRTAAIEGVVTSAQGPVQAVRLSINPHGPRLRNVAGGMPVLSIPVGPDGRFKYTGVPPGQYTISARSSGSSPAGRMGGAGGSGAAGPPAPLPPSAQVHWALADVAVQGEDVTVSLDLQPALRMSGHARFDGTSKPPEPLTGVGLMLSVDGSPGAMMINNTVIGPPPVPAGALRADGTFEINGLLPGTYRLSATMPGPSGWWLRSAMIGGRDVLDVQLVVGRDDIGGAVLTFSDRQSELSGRLHRADGAPAFDSTIVAFSTNSDTWRKGSRRIRTAVPASDGHYIIRGLPGGEYFIGVLPDVDPALLHDREFLTQLSAASLKITLTDGEKKSQDLQLR